MIGTDRRAELAARRARLVQRAAQQRHQLGLAAAPLAQAWRWVERGVVAWQFMRYRPWLVIAPMAAWAWWRPHGTPRALAAALAVWHASRGIRRLGRR
jgi:hypothetical protein